MSDPTDRRQVGTLSENLSIAKWCRGQARTSGRIIVTGNDAWPGDWIVRHGETFVVVSRLRS